MKLKLMIAMHYLHDACRHSIGFNKNNTLEFIVNNLRKLALTASHKNRESGLLSYINPEDIGPWGMYLEQVDRVTPYLGNLSRWIETLKRPKKILIVDVPIELDNGEIAHFEGYRVQHNLSRGPGKGGIRYHQDVTLSEVMALSGWMSVKNAAMNLPFGGAKGGHSR